jgi:Recombinase
MDCNLSQRAVSTFPSHARCAASRPVTQATEAKERGGAAPRTSPPAQPVSPATVVHEAARVERLAYTRTQAAEALGISRSTFDRRVLPLLATIEMPWGARLVPVAELQRLLAGQRRPAPKRAEPKRTGRPPTLAPELVQRILLERAAGSSLAEIARQLNRTGTPTAHGGAQWWPSTVRALLLRVQD